jgi:hypothetical protein
MSSAVSDLINMMCNSENSDEAQWGREMARANKYDLGEYDLFQWFSNEILVRSLEVTPEKFNVPQGNLLVTFGEFMVVHITQSEQVQTRYVILSEDKKGFIFYPLQLQADFTKNAVGVAPWFQTPANQRKPNKKRHKLATGELFNLTGNILIVINSALAEGFLKPNSNIIPVDSSQR